MANKKNRIKDNVDRQSWQPQKLDKRNLAGRIKKLVRSGAQVNDQYLSQLEELFLLRNPRYRFIKEYHKDFKGFVERHAAGAPLFERGNWFYFPWLKQVVHYLPENMHLEMRTGRNKFLITVAEQDKFYNAKVGIMGMSVGSHVALTMAMTGGARHIRLADPDIISGPNLNRVRTGLNNVGLRKTYYVGREIMAMNPYSKIEVYSDGITDGNIKDFIEGLDLLVEEMDNPYFKFRAREIARKSGIPVIMAADNGDGSIVDVERFDSNRKLPVLHGIFGKKTSADFKNIPPMEIPRTIAKIAGANIADLRMLDSVLQVGKTIYSWPQLGTAATTCGVALTYLARNVILKNNIASGRYEVNMDQIFIRNFNSPTQMKARDAKRKKYLKMMGLG